MNKPLVLSVVVVVTAIAFFLMPAKLKPDFAVGKAEAFCRKCERVLTERLRSPSSYRRINCGQPQVTVATEDEFMGWNWQEKKDADLLIASRNAKVKKNQDFLRQSFQEGKDFLISARFEYDAANGFGTALRDTAICEAVIYRSSDYSNVNETSVRVNGDTNLEWALRGLN